MEKMVIVTRESGVRDRVCVFRMLRLALRFLGLVRSIQGISDLKVKRTLAWSLKTNRDFISEQR